MKVGYPRQLLLEPYCVRCQLRSVQLAQPAAVFGGVRRGAALRKGTSGGRPLNGAVNGAPRIRADREKLGPRLCPRAPQRAASAAQAPLGQMFPLLTFPQGEPKELCARHTAGGQVRPLARWEPGEEGALFASPCRRTRLPSAIGCSIG